jgi:hypothetical protein
MKAITVAMALNAGKVKPDTVIQTGGGTMTIGPATIRDDQHLLSGYRDALRWRQQAGGRSHQSKEQSLHRWEIRTHGLMRLRK